VSERTFFDTNMLVYADDRDAGQKSQIAQELLGEAIRSQTAVLSTQVLQEYFVVSTRKLKVPPEIARQKVDLLSNLEVVQIDVGLILEAIDLALLRQFSFWDALILSCARAAGCARLLTEDLHHGQIVAGVRVVNPFHGPV
jgi:predicted nucleic acid-binding protein